MLWRGAYRSYPTRWRNRERRSTDQKAEDSGPSVSLPHAFRSSRPPVTAGESKSSQRTRKFSRARQK